MPERERGRRRPAPFFLVNNAGVFKDIAKRSKTTLRAPDGIEIHWRINFLGTFHLISLLPPLLQRAGQRTGDARVVITSSDVHHKGYKGIMIISLLSIRENTIRGMPMPRRSSLWCTLPLRSSVAMHRSTAYNPWLFTPGRSEPT